jgi:hypothetical protein
MYALLIVSREVPFAASGDPYIRLVTPPSFDDSFVRA